MSDKCFIVKRVKQKPESTKREEVKSKAMAPFSDESKELLKVMGIQVVQAPSEAEAQAAYMTNIGEVYGVASQDYDALMFKAGRLIQNLTLARRRKTVSGYVEITPQLIELKKVLNSLGINHDQLICLGILAGTDYNPGGVRGIGQKKALDLVKKYKYPVKIFGAVEEQIKKQEQETEGRGFDWQEIFELFHKPKVKDVEIKFPRVNEKKIKEILADRDFSENRIESALEKFNKLKEQAKQRTLF